MKYFAFFIDFARLIAYEEKYTELILNQNKSGLKYASIS